MAYTRKTFDLILSDELRNLLKEIETESQVASLLLKNRHDKEDLVDNPVNFISISREDRTKISYLTPERMEQIDISDYWTSTRRFQAKPGAIVTKLFKNISGREVEKFSNLFRSQINKPIFEFSIIKGNRIRDYYHHESYASSEKGSLGASCMKHDSCQKYLDLYADNDDVISMLIMKDSYNQLIGRALLWNFGSHKIMDRIYTYCDEELLFYFKQWATNNGYLYKSEQNWFNTLQFEQLGSKRQELKLEVTLKNSGFRYFPYMDTFKFFDTKTRTLTNYQTNSQYLRTLCSSEGGMNDGDYLRFDGIDRVLRYQGDSGWVDYLGIYTHFNNICWSDINGQYILHKDSLYSEEIEDHIFAKEYDHLNNHEVIERRKREVSQYREKQKSRRTLSATDINSIISGSNYDQLDVREISRILDIYGNQPASGQLE